MTGSLVDFLGVFALGAGPQQRGPLARLHRDVECWEGCLASFLHIRQVQEECQHARTAGQSDLRTEQDTRLATVQGTQVQNIYCLRGGVVMSSISLTDIIS